MNRVIMQIVAGLIGIWLVTGCCATRQASQWEYKVAEPAGNSNNTRQALEPFLNDMAKDGWIFIQRDATGWCYFKRLKH